MQEKKKICNKCKNKKNQIYKDGLMVLVSLYFLGCTIHSSYILVTRLIDMF